MPRVYVEFSGLNQVGVRCKSIASKIDLIQEDFKSTVQQLDWDICFESNINSTATQIVRKLEQYSKVLEVCQSFIDDTYKKYVSLDEEIMVVAIDLPYKLQPIPGSPYPSADFLERVKTFLDVFDKWGDKSEAGVLKEIISYIENFKDFFFGDKTGVIGIGNWFSLANSSVKTWTGLYDYYHNMYDGIKTGFFGDIAQKNVKIVGVSSSLLGLVASVLSASNDLNSKQWQSIVADYIDCGKDILSVISSSYELKHISDVKSLSEIKTGFWNALDVYSAIGEAGIQAISQGFRSHEKYYADGQWDMKDTGATGIDISIAGIYGISHKLTLGFDDFIFNIIDNASGGNGTADMSYFEKAAEGYKILANKCGEAIGNWWIDLIT